MRVEFSRPEDPESVVGTAFWEDGAVRLESSDEGVRATLAQVFRASPVVVEDATLRTAGASGETVVEPGDLEWFRVAARVRGEREGLSARLVSDSALGWDPAGSYDPMGAVVAGHEGSLRTHGLGTSRA